MKISLDKKTNQLSITEVNIPAVSKVSSTGKTRTWIYEIVAASYQGQPVKIKLTMYEPLKSPEIIEL